MSTIFLASHPSRTKHKTKSGFTLLELSLVLVIIGLVTGGVLVGRELIAAAELRSIWNEKAKIETAINTFKLKYNCLPGDCANATTYFGSSGGTGADVVCWAVNGSNNGSTGTCNGDGNGIIGIDGDYYSNEHYVVWQHLAKANLIDGGPYASGGVNIGYGHKRGYNTYASAYGNGAVWTFTYFDTKTTPWFDPASAWNAPTGFPDSILGRQMLWFGQENYNTGGGYYSTPYDIMNGATSYLFDSKFDDGLPFAGQIIATTSGGGFCTQAGKPVSDPTAQYDLTATKKCYFLIRLKV